MYSSLKPTAIHVSGWIHNTRKRVFACMCGARSAHTILQTGLTNETLRINFVVTQAHR